MRHIMTRNTLTRSLSGVGAVINQHRTHHDGTLRRSPYAHTTHAPQPSISIGTQGPRHARHTTQEGHAQRCHHLKDSARGAVAQSGQWLSACAQFMLLRCFYATSHRTSHRWRIYMQAHLCTISARGSAVLSSERSKKSHITTRTTPRPRPRPRPGVLLRPMFCWSESPRRG